MSKKRARGEGTIRPRKDREGYEARLTVGYNEKGRQVQKSIYGETKEEVKMLPLTDLKY